MANHILDEMIDYVAILAKLELSEEEKKQVKADMSEILDDMDKLNELDTSNVVPMSHIFPLHNVFREDVAEDVDGQAAALANAPMRTENGFQVPRTIG